MKVPVTYWFGLVPASAAAHGAETSTLVRLVGAQVRSRFAYGSIEASQDCFSQPTPVPHKKAKPSGPRIISRRSLGLDTARVDALRIPVVPGPDNCAPFCRPRVKHRSRAATNLSRIASAMGLSRRSLARPRSGLVPDVDQRLLAQLGDVDLRLPLHVLLAELIPDVVLHLVE